MSELSVSPLDILKAFDAIIANWDKSVCQVHFDNDRLPDARKEDKEYIYPCLTMCERPERGPCSSYVGDYTIAIVIEAGTGPARALIIADAISNLFPAFSRKNDTGYVLQLHNVRTVRRGEDRSRYYVDFVIPFTYTRTI